jgi:hypothetical protein
MRSPPRLPSRSSAEAQAFRDSRVFVQQQLQQKEERTRLLAEAERQRDRDRGEMDGNVGRKHEQILREIEERRRAANQHRADIDSFLRQRAALRAEGRRRQEEETRRMDQFKADLDDRFARAGGAEMARSAEAERRRGDR